MRLLTASLCLALLSPAVAEAASAWRHDPARDRVGRIYHYLRTNSDGSEPERVRVFRRTATDLAVNKAVEPCTNAAYVTATLDLAAGEARSLTGGRLTRQGTQDPFAYLTVDPASPRVTAHVELPGQTLDDTAEAGDRPRVVYDFDLADLTVLAPHLSDPRQGFSFGVVLLWPPAMPDFLQNRGRLDAAFEREETRNGRPALRFRVTGAPFGDKPGTLWLDAAEGHVLEADFPLPNHDNYDDFKLVLERVEDTGEPGWAALLASHWAGCPAPTS